MWFLDANTSTCFWIRIHISVLLMKPFNSSRKEITTVKLKPSLLLKVICNENLTCSYIVDQ